MSLPVVHSRFCDSFSLDLERCRRHLLEERRSSSDYVETSEPFWNVETKKRRNLSDAKTSGFGWSEISDSDPILHSKGIFNRWRHSWSCTQKVFKIDDVIFSSYFKSHYVISDLCLFWFTNELVEIKI